MAAFLVARQSAHRANQTLFYVQAVDAPLGITPSRTKKLPGIVLFHHNMRVRFTTTIQQPFAVQDVEGTVVGFDPDPADDGTKSRLLSTSSRTAEWPCRLMPKAIYVKIDECAYQFLPPGTCALHRPLGHDDRNFIDLRHAAQDLGKHRFEDEAKVLDGVDKGLFVPTKDPLSMFNPTAWTKCCPEFWYGDALPNMPGQPRKITCEQLFAALPDREELEYQLDSDTAPYRLKDNERHASLLCASLSLATD